MKTTSLTHHLLCIFKLGAAAGTCLTTLQAHAEADIQSALATAAFTKILHYKKTERNTMDDTSNCTIKPNLEDDIRDIVNYYCLNSDSQRMTSELLEVFKKHLAFQAKKEA